MNERLAQIDMEIRRELSRLIPGLKDPRVEGLVSVSRVETARDLSASKIYISVLERPGEVLAGLKSASGYLRRELGHALSLRHTPELVFVRDESIKEGAHVLELMEKAKVKRMGTADDPTGPDPTGPDPAGLDIPRPDVPGGDANE